MIVFVDGPAAGKTPTCKRAPVYLRVGFDSFGNVDALDGLEAKPRKHRTYRTYRRIGPADKVYIRAEKKAASGWYAGGEYELSDQQATQDECTNNDRWCAWRQSIYNPKQDD